MTRLITDRIVERIARAQAADEGQGLAEYGLILALIALACIAGLTLLGERLAGSSGFVDLPRVL
jgi:pilus assembly protein Flp/PilA